MALSQLRYDRWKAPAGDGDVLIWPPPQELLQDARDNHQRLASADTVHLQNIPLPALRREMRRWLGHTHDDAPWIGAGHQTELYHPGVWAKNALIDVAASHLGGSAVHFAIDTDEPKHLQIRLPSLTLPLLEEADAKARWAALLPAPPPAHIAELKARFSAASANLNFRPMLGEFFDDLRRLSLESPPLPAALANAFHALDWKLGLRHEVLLASPIWLSPPFLVFAHHVLARSDHFAADYNAALADYRQENKIRSPGRPMPDLQCTADGCESPFWLDSLADGTRQRATVARTSAGKFTLRAQEDRFELDPSADGWEAADRLSRWLLQHQLRLSPRALTLTAVLRLLAVDQFAHGIGGGQYDQVLDALIARHWRLDPPRFCVTTATLYFPEAAQRSRVCLPCVKQEGRRLKHDLLGHEKQDWVRRIEAAPRRSAERASLFFAMHDKLASAWKSEPARRWEERYEQAERDSATERTIFDRELFYAVQPPERLTGLIQRIRESFV
jgi:hypothetical protein